MALCLSNHLEFFSVGSSRRWVSWRHKTSGWDMCGLGEGDDVEDAGDGDG